MNICRQCFREKSQDIGFVKVGHIFRFPCACPLGASPTLTLSLFLYSTDERVCRSVNGSEAEGVSGNKRMMCYGWASSGERIVNRACLAFFFLFALLGNKIDFFFRLLLSSAGVRKREGNIDCQTVVRKKKMPSFGAAVICVPAGSRPCGLHEGLLSIRSK